MGALAHHGAGVSSLRTPCAEDAERLAELAAQLGYKVTPEAIWARCAALDVDETVIVIEQAGIVAGWLQVGRNRAIESAPHAEIRALVVAAELRGQSLGAQLVAAAERWTRERGLPSLRVRSNVVRDDAHRFYARLGFSESKRQVVFKKDLI